jgi:hypothetical protein
MKHAPLYGIWNVDRFTVGGSTPDAANWRQLTIEFVGRLSVRDNRAERIYYRTKYDESKHTLNLTAERPKQSGDFTYVQPDSEHLELRGSLNGISVTAEFHRLDISRLLLTNRGFHWISEDPFNR